MGSIKELSSLLASLYAAPLEPEMWQVFLDHLCALTNTASAYMVAVDPEKGNVTLAGGGLAFNPETLHLYNQHYGANDPYAAPAMANPRVGIIQAEELVSRTDLFRSELYNEVLHPFDLEYMVLMSCGRADEAGPCGAARTKDRWTLLHSICSRRCCHICRRPFSSARK